MQLKHGWMFASTLLLLLLSYIDKGAAQGLAPFQASVPCEESVLLLPSWPGQQVKSRAVALNVFSKQCVSATVDIVAIHNEKNVLYHIKGSLLMSSNVSATDVNTADDNAVREFLRQHLFERNNLILADGGQVVSTSSAPLPPDLTITNSPRQQQPWLRLSSIDWLLPLGSDSGPASSVQECEDRCAADVSPDNITKPPCVSYTAAATPNGAFTCIRFTKQPAVLSPLKLATGIVTNQVTHGVRWPAYCGLPGSQLIRDMTSLQDVRNNVIQEIQRAAQANQRGRALQQADSIGGQRRGPPAPRAPALATPATTLTPFIPAGSPDVDGALSYEECNCKCRALQCRIFLHAAAPPLCETFADINAVGAWFDADTPQARGIPWETTTIVAVVSDSGGDAVVVAPGVPTEGAEWELQSSVRLSPTAAGQRTGDGLDPAECFQRCLDDATCHAAVLRDGVCLTTPPPKDPSVLVGSRDTSSPPPARPAVPSKQIKPPGDQGIGQTDNKIRRRRLMQLSTTDFKNFFTCGQNDVNCASLRRAPGSCGLAPGGGLLPAGTVWAGWSVANNQATDDLVPLAVQGRPVTHVGECACRCHAQRYCLTYVFDGTTKLCWMQTTVPLGAPQTVPNSPTTLAGRVEMPDNKQAICWTTEGAPDVSTRSAHPTSFSLIMPPASTIVESSKECLQRCLNDPRCFQLQVYRLPAGKEIFCAMYDSPRPEVNATALPKKCESMAVNGTGPSLPGGASAAPRSIVTSAPADAESGSKMPLIVGIVAAACGVIVCVVVISTLVWWFKKRRKARLGYVISEKQALRMNPGSEGGDPEGGFAAAAAVKSVPDQSSQGGSWRLFEARFASGPGALETVKEEDEGVADSDDNCASPDKDSSRNIIRTPSGRARIPRAELERRLGSGRNDKRLRSMAARFSWRSNKPVYYPLEAGVSGVMTTPDDQAMGSDVALQLTSKQLLNEIKLVEGGLIDQGSAGVLFKCVWPTRFGPNAMLAIKALKSSDKFDFQYLMKSYMYEAKVLSRCRHPNVVRLLGYCLERPTVCLIMELLPGSLWDLLYRPDSLLGREYPRLSMETLIQFTSDIAAGLAHLHAKPETQSLRETGRVVHEDEADVGPGDAQVAIDIPQLALHTDIGAKGGKGAGDSGNTAGQQLSDTVSTEADEEEQQEVPEIEDGGAPALPKRVVHRDLKPGNILISAKGRAKISDFGLARQHSNTESQVHTQFGGAGTLHYLAPELIAPGNSSFTSKVDIYSLGMMMYEMVTRHPPWSISDGEVLAKVCQGERPALPAQASSSSDDPWPPSLTSPRGPKSYAMLQEYCALIRACWQQNPADRPSAAEVLQRLQQLRPY